MSKKTAKQLGKKGDRPPALEKIATCYNPSHESGSGRLVTIMRDNTGAKANHAGRYVVATVKDRIADWSTRAHTEEAALKTAAELGYTDVLRPD